MKLSFVLTFILLSPLTVLADAPDMPVGLLLSAGDAKVVRLNTETPINARIADLLFSGDSIRTGALPATVLFCGGKTTDTFSSAAEVRFDATQVKLKSGKITTEKPANSCLLPKTLRLSVASQQHYGVTMTRDFNEKLDIAALTHDKLPVDVQKELAPFEKVLAEDPNDTGSLVAMAAIFEQANLPSNAIETYSRILKLFPDAVWAKSKLFDLNLAVAEQAKASAAANLAEGSTYAILIGVSKYKSPELSLQFADKDASFFADALASPRVGALSPDHVLLLTNEKATTAAVRSAFQTFLKQRAGKKDTVIVMIAGHGTVETPGSKNAFILTYDTDPQDIQSTALPMTELQELFKEQLARVGRVLMFVDVCKAGVIGSIHNLTINNDVQQLQDAPGDLFLFLASRPREKSIEAPDYGGGHGVFSYFVVRGLMGDADEDKNSKVDLDELIKFVTNSVETATKKAQHPNYAGQFEGGTAVSDLSKPGVPISQRDILRNPRTGEPLYFAGQPARPLNQDPELSRRIADFGKAVQEQRLEPGKPGNAYDLLDQLRNQLSPELFSARESDLRVALENRAQEVLLRYLAGDQIPQTQADFAQGARDMEVARKLMPESLFLEGRQDFFSGRALLFDKKFPEAASLLENAVRIDPGLGYAYNALGIAYLEQAQFDKAIQAFHDASRRAQLWAYPLHNLALAYSESGDYDSAIRSYQDAMKLAPKASYLPYNLGLLYQRIGRRKDAEAAYKRAAELAPQLAKSYNALGALAAAQHKNADAERYYRMALDRNPEPADRLATRNNLALLISESPQQLPQAIELWRQNLAEEPDHTTSRLALAEALSKNGQVKEAIQMYQLVLMQKPDYTGARIALAQLMIRDGRNDDALNELREAAKREPSSYTVQEAIGDAELADGTPQAALEAYRSALDKASDPSQRKQLQKKIKKASSSKP